MCRKIRSYQITKGFDIGVTDHTVDPPRDISSEYQKIAHDDFHRLVDAFIDVYEVPDGSNRSLIYNNPKDPVSRASFRVLLDIFHTDMILGRI
jgi:hypothetical protein